MATEEQIRPQDRPNGGSTRNDAATSRQTTDAGGDARRFRSPGPVLGADGGLGSLRGDFGNHPHRGIETVTYVVEGRIDHYDNQGHEGTILPGDAQWMTAGRGLIHNEIPAEGVSSSQPPALGQSAGGGQNDCAALARPRGGGNRDINDLAPEWAIGLEAWPIVLRILLDCRSGWAGSR